jgi:hypothetical protein
MRGGYNHNWNPTGAARSTVLGLRFTTVDGATLACASIVNTTAIVLTPGSGCDPNYSVGQVGVITRWTPVKNLTFSGDLLYSHLDQHFSGIINTTGGYGTGNYRIANQETYQLLLRAQRTGNPDHLV